MAYRIASRIRNLPEYPFAVIDRKVTELREKGLNPVDFGVGDPTIPTPGIIRERLKTAVDERASSGYPSTIGTPEFRNAAAAWMERRFHVNLDPAEQVTTTVGSKEGIFNFPLGFVETGDIVLCPSPGYPPYVRGSTFAGAEPYALPLTRENKYLPDLDAIPDDVAKKARILWLCYPNAPTGANAPDDFFEQAIAWARERDIIVVNDEAYSDIYYGDAPRSILEFAGPDATGVVSFFSMSKRSAMTGWRLGWTAGDKDIIATFRKVKTNIDSGSPSFIQDASVVALEDETHVEGMRADYKQKRDMLAAMFHTLGFDNCAPEATIHYWQRLPDGTDAIAFAESLLHKDVAVVCTPGPWVSDVCADGSNPGEGHVRFSLVPSVEDTTRACDAIVKHLT